MEKLYVCLCGCEVFKLELLMRLQRKTIRNRALLSDMFDLIPQSNYKKQSTKYGQINSFHSVFTQFLTYNSCFNFPLFGLYVWLWKSCVLSNIALDFDMIYKSFKSKHIKTAGSCIVWGPTKTPKHVFLITSSGQNHPSWFVRDY